MAVRDWRGNQEGDWGEMGMRWSTEEKVNKISKE